MDSDLTKAIGGETMSLVGPRIEASGRMQSWARLLLLCGVLSAAPFLMTEHVSAIDCDDAGRPGQDANSRCMNRIAPAAMHPKLSLSERYPGPWVEVTQEIRDLLDSNKIRACTQAMGRQSANDPGEYLLYCTRDEKLWTRWRVWPATHKIRGPDEIFAIMTPPDGY
jgi:hypothetical protein